MSLPNQISLAFLYKNTYEIEKSLRLRSSAGSYLSRTIGTPTSSTTWTWSGWAKRGTLGATQTLLGSSTNTTANWGQLVLNSSDQLECIEYTSVAVGRRISSAVYRDPSAHYHVVYVYDSTNAVAADRMRLYVNGVRLTDFGTSVDPALAAGSFINRTAANINNIGRIFHNGATGNLVDGYLSEINFIDGQALDPSYFGKTDPVTGAWVPKKYAGSYGNNGFYLDFKDGTSLTTLGNDKSGNGNNWTLNNVSLTSGGTYDWMEDTPTNNYPTFNPLKLYTGNLTLSWGNQSAFDNTATLTTSVATQRLPTTGKWFWEVTAVQMSAALGFVGAASEGQADGNGAFVSLGAYRSNGTIYNLAAVVQGTAGATYASGDVIGVAVDVDAGTCQFYKNGVAQGASPSFSFTPGTVLVPFVGTDNTAGTKQFYINFGQRPFAHTPPAGFKALCTKNLPVPTIKNPSKYFDAKTYTGTGALRSVTGVGFAPDLVWGKARSFVQSNGLYDTVRGVTKAIYSDLTIAEATDVNSLTAFNSDGFSAGSSTSLNQNASSYIAWLWKRSAISGFDIVTYTGTGVARTVPHGLGVAPALVIAKSRSQSTSRNWAVYHKSMAATPEQGSVWLNLTNAYAAASTVWNDTAPTGTEFTVGTSATVNGSAEDYVAYLFAEVPGFSKFGSYTGNGSADGPFVWCGFRPRWVMIKQSDAAGSWTIFDTARESENFIDLQIYPNSSGAEGTSGAVLDIVSNGFKLRRSTTPNASGGTYIYAAFAELPFKYANAR